MTEQNSSGVSKESKHFSEKIFVATQQLRVLSSQGEAQTTSNKSANKGLLFNDLVYCVCCPATERAQTILREVNSSLSLRTQYLWILNRYALSKSAEQVAASTENELWKRETDMFILYLKPDPSVDSQVYVLLQLKADDPLEQSNFTNSSSRDHGLFLHCLLHDEFHVLRLPSFTQGKTQVLIEKDSKIYSVLSDAETQIFLQK